MATWIRVLFMILQYGPVIWKIVMEIIDLINAISACLSSDDVADFKAERKERLADAVAYYRIVGDRVKLDELHGELTTTFANAKRGRGHVA